MSRVAHRRRAIYAAYGRFLLQGRCSWRSAFSVGPAKRPKLELRLWVTDITPAPILCRVSNIGQTRAFKFIMMETFNGHRQMHEIYLYMLSAALTISGLVLVALNWRERRSDVLSGRYTEKDKE